MKDFEKEKLQQSIKFNEQRKKDKERSKRKIIFLIVLATVLIIIGIITVIVLNAANTKKEQEKFLADLELVYHKVIQEQEKSEIEEEYRLIGSSALSRTSLYQDLYTYVEKTLNTKINEDYYILSLDDLVELGLSDMESEYLVSYQNKVVFSTKPMIINEEIVYTLDNILQNYEIKQIVDLSGANPPIVFEGMNPVIYNNDINNWEIVKDIENTLWYNYSEKMWANVMLSDCTDGDVSNLDGSYYVWIPRFAYKMSEKNYHNRESGTFEIKFLKENTNVAIDGTIINENNKNAKSDYVIHPAFKFGEELTGIWVSKYEASNNQDSYKSLQDSYSWTNITLSEAYDISKEMKYNDIYGINENEIDTHLIKNTEWGAVAYLAHSKYGKNGKEIWINPYLDNEGIKTGYSGRKVSESNYGNDTVYYWNSINGVKSSTTGNVYGIYDMSGGSIEKVAAYVDNGSDYLLIDGKSLYEEKNEKYFDKYYINEIDGARGNYNKAKDNYGDAIYETSYSESGDLAWFSDNSTMAAGERCFFLRGGKNSDSTSAGIFAFLSSSGGKYSYSGFRNVITKNTD